MIPASCKHNHNRPPQDSVGESAQSRITQIPRPLCYFEDDCATLSRHNVEEMPWVLHVSILDHDIAMLENIRDHCVLPDADVVLYPHALGVSGSHLRVVHRHYRANWIEAGDPRLRVAKVEYLALDDNRSSMEKKRTHAINHNQITSAGRVLAEGVLSAILVCAGAEVQGRRT
ncbi:hypothetical protein FHL15_008739 [Xylaria flabelliformis]|uniref:Uncharacterized protein n=1 Tax=Xylaria flabelliformis TaxID=2512241 RepID=A0A553HQY9_9PEZI|nr:hypothetical protein FHL15_008739 [Xylaria flabelliformis]